MSGPSPLPVPTLAEAEEIIRSWKLGGGSRMAVIMAEYDRRGAELAAAHELAEKIVQAESLGSARVLARRILDRDGRG